jgi:hypothetical protein
LERRRWGAARVRWCGCNHLGGEGERGVVVAKARWRVGGGHTRGRKE